MTIIYLQWNNIKHTPKYTQDFLLVVTILKKNNTMAFHQFSVKQVKNQPVK